MILYHGTDIESAKSISSKILLSVSKMNLDFGPGFYATNDKDTAIKWACRKARLRNSFPSVVELLYEPNAVIPIKTFENILDWGRFVINNRNGEYYIEQVAFKDNNLDCRYDIVYGRIADYSIHEVARTLLISSTELQDVSSILNADYPFQYSFHTLRGLGCLTVLSFKEVI